MNESPLKTYRLFEITGKEKNFRFIFDKEFLRLNNQHDRHKIIETLKDFRTKYIDESSRNRLKLIGKGQAGGASIYELEGTQYCVKVSRIGIKDNYNRIVVGDKQEDVFEIQNLRKFVLNLFREGEVGKLLNRSYMEGGTKVSDINLATLKLLVLPVLGIVEDGEYVYQFMQRLDDVVEFPEDGSDMCVLGGKIKAQIGKMVDKLGMEINDATKVNADLKNQNLLYQKSTNTVFLIDPRADKMRESSKTN